MEGRSDLIFDNLQKLEETKVQHGIKQFFPFTEEQLACIEEKVDKLIQEGETGRFNELTVDCTPLRKRYFFGERYTYDSELSEVGEGLERLYPKGSVDPIPDWISEDVITPLTSADIFPEDFVNCVVIDDYQPGGSIISHIDPAHIFERPIISLSLFRDSKLLFGCKLQGTVASVDLPRGAVTLISGYAADEVTHSICPEDAKSRRVAIILRKALFHAPRLRTERSCSCEQLLEDTEDFVEGQVNYIELQAESFRKFYHELSKVVKKRGSSCSIFKRTFGRKNFKEFKRFCNEPYKLVC